MVHTIFDNYYSKEREDEARQYLFNERREDDERGEDEKWEKLDDVPQDEVWKEMNAQQETNWDDDVNYELRNFIDKGHFLVMGTFGSWRGALPAGKLVSSFNDLAGAWKDCDYINIYDENGHLYIKCSHHDGTNSYEVKRLTEQGLAYLRNNWLEHDQVAHNKVFNCNLYSALPHYANIVFGCKKYA